MPKRGGKMRELAKEDFSQKSAIFLRPKAQFDYLASLPDSEDRAKAIISAMESIEQDYENLRGVRGQTSRRASQRWRHRGRHHGARPRGALIGG